MLQLFVAVLSLVALTVAGAAFAGAATDVVKTKQTALFDLLRQPQGADSQKKIDGVFDEMLDYAAVAQGSLGPEWAARSDAEKAEFSDLLKKLVRSSYQRNLKKILDFSVNYTTEVPADGGTMVKTSSKKAGSADDPVSIDFKMVSTGGTWKVQDIVTEDVSLVSSYRGQFTKVIKKDGFPALIQKMKDKLAKGDTQ
jgi:phospholipid transport system substrate-binding protein